MALAIIDIALFVLLGIIVSNFGVYPILLKVISKFRTVEHRIDNTYQPSVTLLIAAYNEENVIDEKIKNSLQLDYPTDLLTVMVVSDGSIDSTNIIAGKYKDAIQLITSDTNNGKAAVLNRGKERITSDIIVLSDANVMYQKDAIKKLVRHFVDPDIGAVSGKVVLLNEGLSYSNAENAYYSVEHKIQKLESDTGNLIGADGAMYAIRQELMRPLLQDTLLDDFVLSMGVIQQGKRLIFEPEALGFEKNLAEMDSEYRRKVRIVAGGMQSLQRNTAWPGFNNSLTAIKFTFHKIIRWLIGPAIVLFGTLLLLRGFISESPTFTTLVSVAISTTLVLALLCNIFPKLLQFKPLSMFNYFVMMIKASVVGCYKGLAKGQAVSWR